MNIIFYKITSFFILRYGLKMLEPIEFYFWIFRVLTFSDF